MSVMDMLAANEAAEEAAAAAQSNPAAGKGKGKGRAGDSSAGAGMGESGSRTAPASDAGSTDDASGHDLGSGGDDVAMDEDDSDEDDDEEGDEEERHARLMGFVGTLGEQAAAAQRAAEDRRSSQLLKEGEFNATAVAATGGGAKRGAVTMEVGERAASERAGAYYSEVLCVAPARLPHLHGFFARNGKTVIHAPVSELEQWLG